MVTSNGPIYSFYLEYKEKNPAIVFFLMIITFGLYLVWWVYNMTRQFDQKGIESPDPVRGLIVLITFPFLIGLFFALLEYYFEVNAVLKSFEIAISYFMIILQLKFLYDFSVSFGIVTNTNPLWWYYSMFFWFLSIVLLYFESYYTLVFMFFPITAIPAMQAFLNKRFETFRKKQSSDKFNYHTRYTS